LLAVGRGLEEELEKNRIREEVVRKRKIIR
jgi:hypothetical protein